MTPRRWFLLVLLCLAAPARAAQLGELPAFSEDFSATVQLENAALVGSIEIDLSESQPFGTGMLVVWADMNVMGLGGTSSRVLACTLEEVPFSGGCVTGTDPGEPTPGCSFPQWMRITAASGGERRGMSLAGYFESPGSGTITIGVYCETDNENRSVSVAGTLYAVHLRSVDGGQEIDPLVLAGQGSVTSPGSFTTVTGLTESGDSTISGTVTVPAGNAHVVVIAGTSARNPAAGTGAYSTRVTIDGSQLAEFATVNLQGAGDMDQAFILAATTAPIAAGGHTVALQHQSTTISAQTKAGFLIAFPNKSTAGTSYPIVATSNSSAAASMSSFPVLTELLSDDLPDEPTASHPGGILLMGQARFFPATGSGPRPWSLQLREDHQTNPVGRIFEGTTATGTSTDYNTAAIIRLIAADADNAPHGVSLAASSGFSGNTSSALASADDSSLVALSLVPVPPPTPTPSSTGTVTNTPTRTGTATNTGTVTNTPTITRTHTVTRTFTETGTPTNTATKSNTPSMTATFTPTPVPEKCVDRTDAGSHVLRGQCTLPEDDGVYLCEKPDPGDSQAFNCHAIPSPLLYLLDANEIALTTNPSVNAVQYGFTMALDLADTRTGIVEVSPDIPLLLETEDMSDAGCCTQDHPCHYFPIYTTCDVNLNIDSDEQYCTIGGGTADIDPTEAETSAPNQCTVARVVASIMDDNGKRAAMPADCVLSYGIRVAGTDLGVSFISAEDDEDIAAPAALIWDADDQHALYFFAFGIGCSGSGTIPVRVAIACE